jgi:hypothetical protein
LNSESTDPLNLFSENNDSNNSIRYRKINDKSASKQVKRLQEKVVSLKKFLNQKGLIEQIEQIGQPMVNFEKEQNQV